MISINTDEGECIVGRVRWLHFSDLHLGNDKATETRLMRRELPEYIAGLNRNFDYAFCTGDIKEWNGCYTDACVEYLKLICKAGMVPLTRLFIVPGNHDVKVTNSERKELIDKLTDWNSPYYTPAEGNISESDIKILKEGETDFINFIRKLLGTERAEMYTKPHFVVKTAQFNILHVDSTLTYGQGRNRDFVIGSGALLDALDECALNKPTILLTHYSFDFLTQQERNEVEKLLESTDVQLWLAGHEHENLIRRQREKFWECQSGNLALQYGARSCFLTGELDLDTGEGILEVHAWYEKKGWALYPFARTGSENDQIYPFVLRLPGIKREKNVSPELFNAREACYQLSQEGNLFDGVKVNNLLFTDLEWNGRTYINNNTETPLTTLMRELWTYKNEHPEVSCNALILGDGGMGKSTMMYQECRRLLEDGKLAVYVSLQAREGFGNERILDYVLKCIYKEIYERSKSRFVSLTCSRHLHPDVTLFIDGFNELTGSGAQRYVAEIKKLSQQQGIQLVISSRLDFLRDYGLSHFWMIHTCDLREEQYRGLFDEKEWNNIVAHKNLRILLRNPMMALLYACTCPVVSKHLDLDYLDWKMPITNVVDLIHDYYLSQIAILLDREMVSGNDVVDSYLIIKRVLPQLGYELERKNTTVWGEDDFERALSNAVAETNAWIGESCDVAVIRKIRRKFRIQSAEISEDKAYNLIVTELCLLKAGSGRVSFSHQVFRDYLSAAYLYDCLRNNIRTERRWHEEKIHRGVMGYLRYMHEEPLWGENGIANQYLSGYREKERPAADNFVANIVNCWLSEEIGERDLSGIDLRGIPLADHLKSKFTGKININNAWVDRQTFINDKHHDCIIDINFSHDGRTMAAISKNGIVSVVNLSTQSQMIVGELGSLKSAVIGYNTDDFLIIKYDGKTVKWPTIAYDIIENGSFDEVVYVDSITEEMKEKVNELKKRLSESDLLGPCVKQSEDGRYLGIGYESGFLQIWDVQTQECIGELSLSDTQISTVSFTPDGTIAALGSGGKIVQVWDVVKRKYLHTLYFKYRVSNVSFPGNEHILECQFSNGTYRKVNIDDGRVGPETQHGGTRFVSQRLLKRLGRQKADKIESAQNGNAIILLENGNAYTWDEKLQRLNFCPGHMGKVTAIAMCGADNRFAASYSQERYRANRNDKTRRDILNRQKVVRVRIVKTGQCQWRLPTRGRSIKKLQFFTANRIILAGLATNGDILLWELINKMVYGKERGEWKAVEVVRNNQTEPMECAVTKDRKTFISAYIDGSLVIRSFSGLCEDDGVISTFPGIDASVFEWEDLKCDDDIKKTLRSYLQK